MDSPRYQRRQRAEPLPKVGILCSVFELTA